MARKGCTKLPLPAGFSRRSFRRDARILDVCLGRTEIGKAKPRENTTGSLGWRLDTKMRVKVGDHWVWVQGSVTFTVINSADLPPEPTTGDPAV
jgi:hypothetical protein